MTNSVTKRLGEIQARLDKASPGPWVKGAVWVYAGVLPERSGVLPERSGPGRCALCVRMGEPAEISRMDINGREMEGHRHRDPNPTQPGHEISSSDGGLVAGNYDTDEGGILEPEDTEFIVHAREDIPALLTFAREVVALGYDQYADELCRYIIQGAAERYLGSAA